MLTRLLAISMLFAAAPSISACGGSNHTTSSSSSSKTHTSSTSTTSAALPTTKASPPSSKLALEVRPALPAGGTFRSSLSAKPGEAVQFHLVLPVTRGKRPPASKVLFTFAGGPAKALTVRATFGRHSAKAVVTSASSKPITLQLLHFTCPLPPAPTFCPATKESGTSASSQLELSVSRTTPVSLSGMVGPVTTKSLPKPTTSALVPPYTVTVGARIAPAPGAAAPTKPTPFMPSVTAKAGDILILGTRLVSKLRGAPQTVTITIDQGPGSTLTETAAVAGGARSQATIKSSNGSKIALVSPRFTCFVAPAPTFCPPLSIKSAARKYILKFSGSPSTPPIVLLATVQAG